MKGSVENGHRVNFAAPRTFAKSLKFNLKETFFPDDPFGSLKNERPIVRAKKAVQYFLPIFEWLPQYKLRMFPADLLAGITISSLAIPQGISYAKLANLPPVIGLYSSFVPPLIYAVFGSSKDLAVGTVASASLMFASIIGDKVSATDDPTLYLQLVFTATFFAGVLQSGLGILRLGFLVDFLSHSTILGFMSGTAIIITLQQLKGLFGLTHFTCKTDIVSVMRSVFTQTHEWKWEPVVIGLCFLAFLLFTRYLKKKKPHLFWVTAISPMLVVVVGCVYAYLTHGDKHGLQTVGHLSKGLNPISIQSLKFDSKYFSATIQAGIITGIISLAEGIAVGRSFAMKKNYQTDGNKEMVAIGLMNIVGSFTSCYLTTGPFSKSAVNNSAGCKTAVSNVVMSICMMLTLLLLPLFSYTPLVALSALIMAAMLGLIEYEEIYHQFKIDKFDFCISMVALLGVVFINMDTGLALSVGLSILRALLYVARPATCNLGNIPNSKIYRDMQQYPSATRASGVLILQLGSPIYFANSSYIRQRISRWIEDEKSKKCEFSYIILDMGGVTSIDMTGIEMLFELQRILEKKGLKIIMTNPRLEVTEKLILSKFIDTIGMNSVFLSVEDAIEACNLDVDLTELNLNGSSTRVSSTGEDDVREGCCALSDSQVINIEEDTRPNSRTINDDDRS